MSAIAIVAISLVGVGVLGYGVCKLIVALAKGAANELDQ